MTELLTAAQMRAIELAAIESGQVTGLELMERAGQGVVEAIFEEWPALRRQAVCDSPAVGAVGSDEPVEYLEKDEEVRLRAVVLCGPGNNGGDGFVVARLLHALGWEVQVYLYGDPARLPVDARANYLMWLEIGDVSPLTADMFRRQHLMGEASCVDLYVDALFGTGLTRPVRGDLRKVLGEMSARAREGGAFRTVAIDSPSGLCMDSGRVLGVGVPSDGDYRGLAASAALTVAFDSPKIGHFIGAGPALCGKLVVKDIGLKEWRVFDAPSGRAGNGEARVLRPARMRLVRKKAMVDDPRPVMSGRFAEVLDKSGLGSHKFSLGHALVLSGSEGKTGAARLAARGALRIGAGLVTLGVPTAAVSEVASQISALMLDRVEDANGLTDVLQDQRLNALCLGPGLGMARARELVPVAMSAQRETVLDADALSAFQNDPGVLFGMVHERCVLTPHFGEFARLFPDLADRLRGQSVQGDHHGVQSGPAYSKVDAAREAAQRAGCVVLFKGPDTVIAAPDGTCAVHAAVYDRSAPWLATAGSGDVLAGFITGLLARGLDPMPAAETAAWLHVECARAFGPGLIAEDLPEQLPAVFRQLAQAKTSP